MRPFNFAPGPAAIPEAVLREAAADMLDWHGCGVGVMEMSHRGKEFMQIAATAQADLRELLGVPALTVRQRWRGVYASAPDPFLIATPFPGVRVVSVTSGIGMTTALGLAPAVLDDLMTSR